MFKAVVVIAALLSLQCTADSLVQIALLHRHGARTAAGFKNAIFICDYPDCQLTDRGKLMLYSVGDAVRRDYGAWINISTYNVSVTQSQSTSVSRCVVSGEALVMGLYPSPLTLPFVDFLPDAIDYNMSFFTSWPSWMIRSPWKTDSIPMNQYLHTYYPTLVQQTAEFLGMPDICQQDAWSCVSYIQDQWEVNLTAGYPITVNFVSRELLMSLQARFFTMLLGYDPTNDYQRQIGSLGYPLAVDILDTFAAAQAGQLFRVNHFSAHDVTVFALYTALGVWTPADVNNSRFVPQFGETVLLELWEKDDGTRQVVAKYGVPQPDAASQYNFTTTFTPIKLLCIRAGESTPYNSTTGCPLDDLQRYVQTTAPASPLGVCYVTDKEYAAANCTINDAPPAGSSCAFYRQYCPNVPCGSLGDGSVADPAGNWNCTMTYSRDVLPFVTATVIALVAPGILGGSILGFYTLSRFYKQREEQKEYEHVGHTVTA